MADSSSRRVWGGIFPVASSGKYLGVMILIHVLRHRWSTFAATLSRFATWGGLQLGGTCRALWTFGRLAGHALSRISGEENTNVIIAANRQARTRLCLVFNH